MRERAGDNKKKSIDESDEKDFLYDIIKGEKILVARWVCEDGEYYLKYMRSRE